MLFKTTIKTLLAVSLLSTSTLALAYGQISQDMREIMQSTRQALRADDSQTFIKAIDRVIDAAKSSKAQTPNRLADQIPDSEAMQDYQHGMQQFIDTANQAKIDAEQGKLDEAKEQVQKLYDLRDVYHPKYK